MKVTYLMNGLGYTGGNIVLYNFMDKLNERGYEVYVVTPKERFRWTKNSFRSIINKHKNNRNWKHSLKQKVKKISFIRNIYNKIYSKENRFDEYILKLTKDLIKNWRPSDFTISTYSLTNFANYFLADKTISLYHMQHYEELFFNDAIAQKYIRMTYSLPGVYKIANSTWLKERIKEKFNEDCFLLNPAIDETIFKPYENNNQFSKIRIVSYSDHRDFKAFDDGARAMQIVYDKIGEDKIEWILFGGYNPKDNKLVKDIPYKYIGKVFNEDLAKLYSDADIVFMPSWYESFPLPPLEAMKCKTAVICTRYGTEDYAENDVNSKVVLPRSPEQLAEAICELIYDRNKRNRLAEEGYKTSKKFTWDNSVDKLEEIFEQVRRQHKNNFSDINKLALGNFEPNIYI